MSISGNLSTPSSIGTVSSSSAVAGLHAHASNLAARKLMKSLGGQQQSVAELEKQQSGKGQLIDIRA